MCFWKLREKLICLVNYMLCTINVHYYFLNLYNHIKFLLLIPSQIPTLQLFTIVIGSYYLWVWEVLVIKHLFKATQVAPSPPFTVSVVHKRWLTTPHTSHNLCAILIALKCSYIDSASLFISQTTGI